MNLSHTTGMTAVAALLAVSGVASADVAAKNIYYAPGGVIVASTCGGISPTLAVGNMSELVAFYPGASGANMTLVSPSTPANSAKAGSTVTYTCRAGGFSPVTTREGLVSATISGTTLTVTRVISGALAVGDAISGTGITAGTTLVSGSGTSWKTSLPATVTKAETVTATAVTGKKWTAAKVPAGGLSGATIPFVCYADSQLGGPGDGGVALSGTSPNPVASVSVAFTANASSAGPAALSVESTETLTITPTLSCSYTTDATWAAR